jgi:hypothetical protein
MVDSGQWADKDNVALWPRVLRITRFDQFEHR